jgi:hypothetical protein
MGILDDGPMPCELGFSPGGADPLAATLSRVIQGGTGGRGPAPNTRVARGLAKVVTADAQQPFPPPAT